MHSATCGFASVCGTPSLDGLPDASSAASQCFSKYILPKETAPATCLHTFLVHTFPCTGGQVSFAADFIGVGKNAMYSSPEALSICFGDVSEKCDVWSVGCILLELLSGQPAFATLEEHALSPQDLHPLVEQRHVQWVGALSWLAL